MIKNTKFIIMTSRGDIPCDEDELVRVFTAINNADIVMLRRGSFNPSHYVGIIQDEKKYKEFIEDKKYQIKEGKIKSIPKYDDIFAGVREQISKLSESKSTNRLIRG